MDKETKTKITRKVNENYMRFDNVDDMKDFIFHLEEIKIDEKNINEAIIHIENKYNNYLPKLAYKKKNDRIKGLTKVLEKIINDSYEINGIICKLDFDEEYNIVKLTKKNATIIENLIKKDSYIQFAQMVYDYYRLSNISIEDNKDALNAVIRMIDYENSTQAYRMYREDYKAMIDGIWNNKETFFDKLKEGDKRLPDYIVEWTGNGGSKIKSLSSKICQHINEFLSKDDRYSNVKKDSFYKNDRYIRHAMLFYLDYYKVPHEHYNKSTKIYEEKYEILHNMLEELKKKVEAEGLTRCDIDHIIWYSYKSYKAD